MSLGTSDTSDNAASLWSQLLQRRVMRLLLLHDRSLFRSQFRLFTAQSRLPQIPLLQQYDQFIKLQSLSNELLTDIVPRIRRQLSLKANRAQRIEEAPTRGTVDWSQSIEYNLRRFPDQVPLHLVTNQRQHDTDTPENTLLVAILLQLKQELQQITHTHFDDEELSAAEAQFFSSNNEQIRRELSATYARPLQEKAALVSIPQLIHQVARTLRPRPSPYRDLIHWWQRFNQFRIGIHNEQRRTLAFDTARQDEKVTPWLYEIWITLEIMHLLQKEGLLTPGDVVIATDSLQCTFSWQQRRFRLHYNRQLDTSSGYTLDWQHAPAVRPDYSIEREQPLEIRYQQKLIWREPPVILDAKYYLRGNDPGLTHRPIKKMLGDMTLLGIQTGVLFFPTIAEPDAESEQLYTRLIQRKDQQYHPHNNANASIALYRLSPDLPFAVLQQRLQAILDYAVQALPERPQPVCQGIVLNDGAADQAPCGQAILCPKAHIGPGIFDIVNSEQDCLKNPRTCHVIGQNIIPPARRQKE